MDYPDSLPLPLITFTNTDTTQFVSNGIDRGPLVFSLVSNDDYSNVNFNFSFSPQEKALFTSFHEDDLIFGAKSFNITLDIDGNRTVERCYMLTPSYASVGKRWRVTAQGVIL